MLHPTVTSQPIEPIVVAILAFLVSFGLGFRAFRGRDWARVGDMIPRLFITGIYVMFQLHPDMKAEERSVWVRYGLVSLLSVELIYNLLRMYWKLQVRAEERKKKEVVNETKL